MKTLSFNRLEDDVARLVEVAQSLLQHKRSSPSSASARCTGWHQDAVLQWRVLIYWHRDLYCVIGGCVAPRCTFARTLAYTLLLVART